MKGLTSPHAFKRNVKSFHTVAYPKSKQVPDSTCLKSGSTEKMTSVGATQLTQVITARSNEITSVVINYKTTELEMKLYRKKITCSIITDK